MSEPKDDIRDCGIDRETVADAWWLNPQDQDLVHSIAYPDTSHAHLPPFEVEVGPKKPSGIIEVTSSGFNCQFDPIEGRAWFNRGSSSSTIETTAPGRNIIESAGTRVVITDSANGPTGHARIQLSEMPVELRRGRAPEINGLSQLIDRLNQLSDSANPSMIVYEDAVIKIDKENGNVIVAQRARDNNPPKLFGVTQHEGTIYRFLITGDQILVVDCDGTIRPPIGKELDMIKRESGEIVINGVRFSNGQATTSNGTILTCDDACATARVPKGDGEGLEVHVRPDGNIEAQTERGAVVSLNQQGQLTIRNQNDNQDVVYRCDLETGTIIIALANGTELCRRDAQGNFRFRNGLRISQHGQIDDDDGHALNGDDCPQTAVYAAAVGHAQMIASYVNSKSTREMTSSDLDSLGIAENELFEAMQACIAEYDLQGLYHLYCAQGNVQSAKSKVQAVLSARVM